MALRARDQALELTGQVAIVTGASSGIGAATARALAGRGAAVVLAARRVPELAEQVAAIRRSGGQALAVATDVADQGQVSQLAERTATRYGRVDILVNSAGVGWRTPLAASPPDRIARLVEVNLLGAMLLTRAVLPAMLDRGCGAIICIGSLSGRVAMEPVYSATKYGLRGFTLALRRQLTGTGVRVSLVSPGNIRTAMTRHVTGQLPEPDLVASAIAGLVRRPSREIVVPRRHYAIAWLEQGLPAVADLAYQCRGWSPVTAAAPDTQVAAAANPGAAEVAAEVAPWTF